MEIREYREKNDFRPIYLSDPTYAAAMRALVIVCVNVLLISQARPTIYLAKRIIEPMPGWWMVGGRVYAGRDFQEEARLYLRRDTGLEVAAERLELVSIHRYFWAKRQQEPQDAGSDKLAFIYRIELSEEEIASASSHLRAEEYELALGLQEFDRPRLEKERVHQAIVDLYNQIFQIFPK